METTGLSVGELEDQILLPSYPKLPFSIERGEGVHVFDQTGKRYLDMYGGHAVSLLGHSHPRLLEALNHQAPKLFFYSSVAYSEIRARAARSLSRFVGGDRRVFFSNSGAEANENAIKLARLLTGRGTVVSLEGSFHGRTLGALAVTGIEKYRKGLGHASEDVRFARFGDIDDLRSQLKEDVAALIIEPIQSLNGVRTAPAAYFQEAAELCRKSGALLIIDEIQTGLGRCGVPMLFHILGIEPDLATLAKGLAGGFPIGATLLTKEWASKVQMGDLGTTFGGGPLACALAEATLETLNEDHLPARVEAVGGYLRERSSKLPIRECRGAGLLLGIETEKSAASLQKALIRDGVLVGTSLDSKTIRLLPPLTVTEEDAAVFMTRFEQALKGADGCAI